MVRNEAPRSWLNSRAAWMKRIAASPRLTMAIRSNFRVISIHRSARASESRLGNGLRTNCIVQSFQRIDVDSGRDLRRTIPKEPQITIARGIYHLGIEYFLVQVWLDHSIKRLLGGVR